MTTLLKLGPKDHGRPIALEEFLNATGQEGYRYEIINGRVYVSPVPNLPHDWVKEWISDTLRLYARQHPDVLNYITTNGRVFVPGHPEVTAPEPDVAAYQGFPAQPDVNELDWRDVSPILVVEIVSEDDPDKDLVRNVRLYRLVPSIQEYWVIDPREDANRPMLTVYRWGGRQRRRKTQTHGPGTTYTTTLLPGFRLTIDPRA